MAEGLPITVDMLALSRTGELVARLAGRFVVQVVMARLPEVYLVPRFAHHIKYGSPAPVLVEHKCQPATAPYFDIDAEQSAVLFAFTQRPANPIDDNSECPF